MLKLLKLVSYGPSTQAVCCKLAQLTSRKAFDILCAKHECRGLVFVYVPDSEHQIGQVFYDKESSWLHSLISGHLTTRVTVELVLTAGVLPARRSAAYVHSQRCGVVWVVQVRKLLKC